jgi:hypothetical protein
MEYYNEKIQDYLKDFEEMNFFINFYLTNVGHHPEKALIRAMDECLENMETELVYNYSESLDYKCMGLSTAQSQIISYLKTNPENIVFVEQGTEQGTEQGNKKEEKDLDKIIRQSSEPIPIKHNDNTIQWQNHISSPS